MWCSEGALSRRAVLIGAALTLAGCGFRPVYGPGGSGEALIGQVAVEAPATDAGFVLRNRMLDRLGVAEAPRYLLSVEIEIRDAASAITTEQVTTRFSLPGRAAYRLTEIATGAVVAEGEVTGFTSYSATGTSVATFSAAADAEERLAMSLADQVLIRLVAVAP